MVVGTVARVAVTKPLDDADVASVVASVVAGVGDVEKRALDARVAEEVGVDAEAVGVVKLFASVGLLDGPDGGEVCGRVGGGIMLGTGAVVVLMMTTVAVAMSVLITAVVVMAMATAGTAGRTRGRTRGTRGT